MKSCYLWSAKKTFSTKSRGGNLQLQIITICVIQNKVAWGSEDQASRSSLWSQALFNPRRWYWPPPNVIWICQRRHQQLRTGSASGPSGVRPQHLKDWISRVASEAGNKALTAITSLVNIILAGLVPSETAPVLSSANLFELKKKDGGVRPIAIGETLRRLPAKCASKIVCHNLAKYFSPLQTGAGTPNG